jgi:hypothetical protein
MVRSKVSALALVAAALVFAPPAQAQEPVPITDGYVDWGVRQSFRTYVGASGITVSQGATINADGTFRFPVESGSYDPATRTTVVNARGTVHFEKHGGQLDVTIADPRVRIDGERPVLVVDTLSRDLESGELIAYDDVEFATLFPAPARFETTGETTNWRGVEARLTEAGSPAFEAHYPPGTEMDGLWIEYTGPGGRPLGSEEALAAPESIFLKDSDEKIVIPVGRVQKAHLTVRGPGDELIWALSNDASNPPRIVIADSDEATIKQELVLPFFSDEPGAARVRARRLFLHRPSGTLFAVVEHLVAWKVRLGVLAIRRNPDGTYAEPTTADIQPLARIAPDLPDYRQALRTATYVGRSEDRQPTLLLQYWESYRPVRDPVTGVSVTPPPRASMSISSHNPIASRWFEHESFPVPDLFELPDESIPKIWDPVWDAAGNRLLVPRPSGSILEVTIAEDGYRTFYPRSQVALPSWAYTALGIDLLLDDQTGLLYTSATALGSFQPRTAVIDTRIGRASELALIDGELPGNVALGILGGDGYVFVAGDPSHMIHGTPGHARIYGAAQRTVPAGKIGYLVDLGDRVASLPVNAGSRDVFFFDKLWTPWVERQPADVQVVAGEDATFDLGAVHGMPAPTLRWQTRAAGATGWTDVEGEAGSRLTVEAGDHGRQYRALLSTEAGTVATDTATVSILSAPAVSLQPRDVSLGAGADAVFEVLGAGNPEPEVTWQRYDGGYWRAVDADSGDVVVDGSRLTVVDANVGQSGSRFRARLRNAVGTAYSSAATLTVHAAVQDAVTFAGGHVDWGVSNRWRCYVVGNVARGGIEVAGGVTQNPGTLATGPLCAGRNAGSETLRFPVLGGSYDPRTARLDVRLGGSVRFWGHVLPGSPPQLDTRLSSLRIVADGATATLFADATGATMENPVPVTRPNVALVRLDLSGVAPLGLEGRIEWGPIQTALTAASVPVFGSYPEGEPFDPLSMALVYGTPQTSAPPAPVADAPPPPAAVGRAAISSARGVRTVGRDRLVRVATLACPAGGTRCAVRAPARKRVWIAGRRTTLAVLAPARIRPGERAAVRLRLSRREARRLAGRRLTIRLEIVLTANGQRTARTITTRIRG